MRQIILNAFLGANTALDPLLLPDGVGVQSTNQQPGFGDLRPWLSPGPAVATVPASPQRRTIYRMRGPTEADYWLSWSGIVHATQGWEADDTTERTYYSGDGAPKWTNNSLGLGGGPPYPQASRDLGVPAPTTAPVATLAVDGPSGGTQASRAYVYTWVNDLGWESAPSDASNLLLVRPEGTVNLDNFDTPPSGAHGINRVRLYRLVTGASGSATFFFLREWAIGSTPANPVDDGRAAGAAVLSTVGWRAPPADGRGLLKMWNGMMSIGSGNGIRICEPYKPYAYPLAYEIPLGARFVAQAVVGQRVLVLTDGDARIVSGSAPPLDDEPANFNRPCVSVQSVVAFNEGAGRRGVMWASSQGLCWWGEGTGFVDVLDRLMLPEQWAALRPDTMVAGRYGRYYVCFYQADNNTRRGFVIDTMDPTGIYHLSEGYHAVYRDALADVLYVLQGNQIRRWHAGTPMTTTFVSKVMQMPAPVNVGAIEVVTKGYPVTVSMWCDGVLRHTETLNRAKIIKPPGGFEADRLQFMVSSAERVIALRVAQSARDLRDL